MATMFLARPALKPVVGWVLSLAVCVSAPAAVAQSDLIQDGKIGFVVSDLKWGVSNSEDPEEICPDGMSLGPRDIFAASPEGQRREGETDAEYTERLRDGGREVLTGPDGKNLCMHPESGEPDPHHPVVETDVAVYGIDLDGHVSGGTGEPAPGTCAHRDFVGVNGEPGIDNQFFRAVGCTNTFGPGGQQHEFDEGMLVGEWGILITLEDVEDLENDDSVTVGIHANNDPIQLSASREALPFATYAIDQDPAYRATTAGRIVDGVLTTDPVDVQFHSVVNAIHLDRPLKDARLQVTISADGTMEGFLAGYSPVEEMYDVTFGFRDGRDATGDLADLRRRMGSSSGYAATARHTCNGVYYAMHEMADGHPDPETGKCTSISTQYRLTAIPAFVVDEVTESVNEDLVR